MRNMNKILLILFLTLLIISCTYATDSTIKINEAKFQIPPQYQGGELNNEIYKVDNTFSIRCIDDNVPKAIGLWASESEFNEDLNIDNHPVRHFSQYNKYVEGNHSHAYFVSNESVYEISWTGEEINKDIEKLIKDTPESKIDEDDFYSALDKSLYIYKQQNKDQLNQDAEYNYLEANYQSQQNTPDDTRFKQILYTYYFNR